MPITLDPGEALVRQFLHLTGDPEPMMVTYGVAHTASSQSEVAAMATSLRGAFVAELGSMLSSTYQTGVTRVTAMVGVNLQEAEAAGSTAGTGGASALPQNCALLVKKSTGLAGRKNRGRLFLPGCAADSEVDATGAIVAGDFATKQTAIDDWLSAIEAATHVDNMIIFHNDGSNAAIVTALNLDLRIATQRRRLR